jgi:hypothetical protein
MRVRIREAKEQVQISKYLLLLYLLIARMTIVVLPYYLICIVAKCIQ